MVKTIRGHTWGTVVSVVRCRGCGIPPTGAAVRYTSKSGKLEFSRTRLELTYLEMSDRKKLSVTFLGRTLGNKKCFYFLSTRTRTSRINSIFDPCSFWRFEFYRTSAPGGRGLRWGGVIGSIFLGQSPTPSCQCFWTEVIWATEQLKRVDLVASVKLPNCSKNAETLRFRYL